MIEKPVWDQLIPVPLFKPDALTSTHLHFIRVRVDFFVFVFFFVFIFIGSITPLILINMKVKN